MATTDSVDVSANSYKRLLNKCITVLSDGPGDTGGDNGYSTCCICRMRGDVTPTSHQCLSCGDTLCETCRKGHRSSSATHAHVVLTISEIREKKVKIRHGKVFSCENHKRSFEYFCGSCQKALCPICLISNHMRHEISPLDDIAKQRRKHLSELSQTMLDDVENPKWKTNTFHRHRDILDSIEKMTMMKVREKSQALIDYILQQVQDLVKHVKHLFDDQRLVLERHEKELEETLEGAKTVAELSRKLIQDGCDEEVVTVADDVGKCLDVRTMAQLQNNVIEQVSNLKTPVYEIHCSYPQTSPLTVTEAFIERSLSKPPGVAETNTLINEVSNPDGNSQDRRSDLKTGTNGTFAPPDETKGKPAGSDNAGNNSETVVQLTKDDHAVVCVDQQVAGPCTENEVTVSRTRGDQSTIPPPGASDAVDGKQECLNQNEISGSTARGNIPVSVNEDSDVKVVSSSECNNDDDDDDEEEEVEEETSGLDIVDSKFKLLHSTTASSFKPSASSLLRDNSDQQDQHDDGEEYSGDDKEGEDGSQDGDDVDKAKEDGQQDGDDVDEAKEDGQQDGDDVDEAKEDGQQDGDDVDEAKEDGQQDGDDVDEEAEEDGQEDGKIFRVTSSLSIVGDYGRSLSTDCSSEQTDEVFEKDDDSVSSARSSSVDKSSAFSPSPIDCDVIPFDSFPQVSFGNFAPKFFVPYLDRIKAKRDAQNAMCLIKEGTVTLTQLTNEAKKLIILGMSLVGEDKVAVLDSQNNRVQLFNMSGKLCNKNHPNKLTESFAPHSIACVGSKVIYISGATVYVTDTCLGLLHQFSLGSSGKENTLLPLCRYKENSVLIANLPKDKISIYNINDNKIEEKELVVHGPIVAVSQYRDNFFLFSSWSQPGFVQLISATGALVRVYRPRGMVTWYPEETCVDSQLNVYVASPRDGKIYVFGTDGGQIYELECELLPPSCLVMKPDNTLIVSGLGSVLHTFKCTFYKKS